MFVVDIRSHHITSQYSMAYNLRSRLTSTSAPEGSGVAQESEGLGLSPVEFAVPMSEQATANSTGLRPKPSDVCATPDPSGADVEAERDLRL